MIKVTSWWENNHTKHGDQQGCRPYNTSFRSKSTQLSDDGLLQYPGSGEPIQGRLRLGTSMTIGPGANKSEPPDDDGQQRDNALSRSTSCLSFPFFDVAMLVFQRDGETTEASVA